MRFRKYNSILAILGLVCTACAGASIPSTSSSASGQPAQNPQAQLLAPTLNEMKNLTYTGINEAAGLVKLQNGRWSGEAVTPGGASRPTVQLADDFRIVGDLDGDGIDDTMGILAYSSGGSGVLSYLAVASRRSRTIINTATALLGDRVQLKSASIENGKLLVHAVRAGSGDAACCPGDLVDLQWTMSKGKLDGPGSVKTGRLSLAVLGGTEWVLRSWNIGESAEPEPAVTLTYDAGRFAGSSGCNRYTGSVTEGNVPGEFSIAPLVGTRMACPGPQTAVEIRFLEQLMGARTYGFMLGRLAISYTKADNSLGTMLFESRTSAR